MNETSAISTALASLAQYISNMNTQSDFSATMPTAHTPLRNYYNPATPFDLYSLAGSIDYADACAPLSKPWYDQVKILP